jgi:hypothetical protein
MIRTRSSSKLLLVADRRVGSPDGGPSVRRYRLARLRLDGRPAGWTIRSERLERS